jgi:predicted dehydrogenase
VITEPHAYRLGIVGLGNRSRSLIRAAQASGRFVITAASDGWPDGTPGRQTPELPQTKYVARWQDLLKEPIDALVVATPNDMHAPIVEAALDRGLHVLCEKPVAHRFDDTLALLRRVRKSTSVFHVGMELRYAPALRALRRRLDAIDHPPTLVWAQEFRPPFRPGVRNWRQDPTRSGGTLLEKNCHHFDLFALILDDRPTNVSATAVPSPRLLIDQVAVTVSFARGGIGVLTLSMLQPQERLRLGALGDGWTYEYDARADVSTWESAASASERQSWSPDQGNDSPEWDHPGEVEQFQAFADRIDGAAEPVADRTNPLWGHVIAFAADDALRDQRTVAITAEGDLA